MLSLAAQGALAQDSAVGDETPAADQATAKAESRDDRGSREEEEFKPPLGFQTKKRGELTLYCKKETTRRDALQDREVLQRGPSARLHSRAGEQDGNGPYPSDLRERDRSLRAPVGRLMRTLYALQASRFDTRFPADIQQVTVLDGLFTSL